MKLLSKKIVALFVLIVGCFSGPQATAMQGEDFKGAALRSAFFTLVVVCGTEGKMLTSLGCLGGLLGRGIYEKYIKKILCQTLQMSNCLKFARTH